MQVFVGIDPGKSGGIAALSPDGTVLGYWAMPDTDLGTWSIFSDFGPNTHATLEKVGAMPGQGVTSMFTFGRGYGVLLGCLAASGTPFDTVTPQLWMKEFSLSRKKGLTKTAWKTVLRDKAQQLFPSLPVWSETKKLQMCVCDSLLIAEYCRRKRG